MPAIDGKTIETINPATEEVITAVQEATEKDVDVAVAAARKAFEGPWKQVTPQDRGKLLVALADLAEKNLDLLASVEALDNGKSFVMAKGDVGAVIGCLRYYGGWADKIEGKVIDTNPGTFSYTRQEPVSARNSNYVIIAKSDCCPGWCLRPNHPMELPSSHACVEDWSCAGNR